MARPRIFLSSTCYDLNDARATLTSFLDGYGFEVLNSQLPSFGVSPKRHSHQACLNEVRNADFIVLIIGGRRGGTFIGTERSITNEEVRLALRLSIPVIAFVDRNVDQQRLTYKRNPRGDFSHAVDDVRIFDFIDYMASGHEDNWLHSFGSVNDIKETLRHQFAHYLGLYSRSLRKDDKTVEPRRLAPVEFPGNLDGLDETASDPDEATQLRSDLRIVYDGIRSILNADIAEGAQLEQLKAIWLIGRHGKADDHGATLKEDRFKAAAWGITRGRRVFTQMEGSKVSGEYDVDEDNEGRSFGVVRIRFPVRRGQDACPGHALKHWIDALLERHDSDEALKLFQRADMRLFSREGSPVLEVAASRPITLDGTKAKPAVKDVAAARLRPPRTAR